MKPTKILLSILGGATLAFTLSSCSSTTSTAPAANAANNSNTAVVGNSNSTAANTAASSTSNTSSASNTTLASNATTPVCDVTAYITDKDPKGLNVRDSASETGKAIGQVPFNKEGTVVHIISSNPSGWVMIDKATIVTATAEKATFANKGWVSANLLSLTTRGYDAGGVELYEGGKGSKVITKIPEDMEVKIIDCSGKRMQVKYKNFTGWLEPDAQCDSPVTRCN